MAEPLSPWLATGLCWLIARFCRPLMSGLFPADEDPGESVDGERLELVAVDHYIEMATNVKVKIESALRERGVADAESAVDEVLMATMVDSPENAMRIGTYYRQRNIAETYARQLLGQYMLKDAPPARVQRVIDGLITLAPRPRIRHGLSPVLRHRTGGN